MATITPYVSENIHAGQALAFKIHEFRWRTVGHGEIKDLSDHEIAIDGRVALAAYRGDLQFRIKLSDQDDPAPTGVCSLQVNSLVDEKATYTVHQDGMSISTVLSGKDVQIELSRAAHDNMTECQVSGPLNLTIYVDPGAS